MYSNLQKRIGEISITIQEMIWYFVAYILISTFFIFLLDSTVLKTIIYLVNYVFIPGSLLVYLMGVKFTQNKNIFIVFSVACGLLAQMLLGLTINFVFNLFSISSPLSLINLVFLFNIFIFTSIYFIYRNKFSYLYKISIPNLNFKKFTPIILVFISILGTTYLNNLNNNYLLIFLHVAIILFYAYAFFKNNSDDTFNTLLIYFSSISLILTFSLRSNYIVGWDINEEFQVFSKTLENLNWSMSYYLGLDYNACLSITILPTIASVITGISPHYIFKFLLQIFFAFIPVGVFEIAKKYLRTDYAILTTLIFISQTWFYEQMPGIIRQEIALLFYFCFIYTLFFLNIKNIKKYILLGVFGIGIVISHYTTSYILVIFFSIFVAYLFILKLFNITKFEIDYRFLVSIILFLITLILVWQVFITNTGDAFKKLISLNKRENKEFVMENINVPLEKNNLRELVESSLPENQPELNGMYLDVVGKYLDKQDSSKFDQLEASKFIPLNVSDIYLNKNYFSNVFAKVASFLGKLANYLIYIILPTIFLLFYLIKKENRSDYFVLYNISGLTLLFLMVLIPYLQIHYNVTRLYFQVFISFCFLSVLYIQTKNIKYKTLIFIITSFLFLWQSGFIAQFIGGDKRITLNVEPADQYQYMITDSEVYSATWLSNIIDNEVIIQSDSMANLRLQSIADTNSYNSLIFPLSVRKSSFVYTTRHNILNNISIVQYKNQTFKYNFPFDFLNSHKNLIYSNKDSLIYR